MRNERYYIVVKKKDWGIIGIGIVAAFASFGLFIMAANLKVLYAILVSSIGTILAFIAFLLFAVGIDGEKKRIYVKKERVKK